MIHWEKRVFRFKRPSGTSRGVLEEKKSWFLYLEDLSSGTKGTGECSIIPGLSPDYSSDEQYEELLDSFCREINQRKTDVHGIEELMKKMEAYPSILFGFETAVADINSGGTGVFFDTPFTRNKQDIPINGLIWMGPEEFMQEQIKAKLNEGFSCIKMKIGAIDFDTERELLKQIRTQYTPDQMVLRADANGAFSVEEALGKLQQLAELRLHSVEQPIKAGNWEAMQYICRNTPVPVALDEELIGVDFGKRKELLELISPQFIILKPSLHGGISGCREWIGLAESMGIGWWMTSALEMNVGLNMIAQFASCYSPELPQGLGTGGLYTENTPARSEIVNGRMRFLK